MTFLILEVRNDFFYFPMPSMSAWHILGPQMMMDGQMEGSVNDSTCVISYVSKGHDIG